jgi:RHS repeat-associated protein
MTVQGFCNALFGGFLMILLSSGNYPAQTRSAVDSSTPAGLALGMSGSNGNDFGTINPFNGALNYNLPILHVGGRGSAGYTISLPVGTRWVMQHSPGGQGEMYNTAGSVEGTPIESRYMPGILYGRKNHLGSDCGSGEPMLFGTQTRLTFAFADRSEIDLVSLTKGGGELQAVCGGPNPTQSRGTVFIGEDGSGIKFVSDVEIVDGFGPLTFAPSGYLHLPDGTAYRIVNGHVSWIKDINGNLTTFTYDGDHSEAKLVGITDSNGRNITITHDAQDGVYGLHDRITYPGFSGSTRSIRIVLGPMSGALRAGETIKTYSQLFAASNLLNPNLAFDPTVVSSVWITDDVRFKFNYNSYGELARVDAPAGAATEYDHGASVASGPMGGVVNTATGDEISRQVLEKRLYPNGASGSSYDTKITVARPAETYQHPEYRSSRVISTTGAQNNLLGRQVHYFYGSPIPHENWFGLYQYDWKEGRAYETRLIGSDESLLRRELRKWTTLSSGPVADPRVSKEIGIVFEGSKALATLAETDYDTGDLEYFAHLNPKRSTNYHYRAVSSGAAEFGDVDTIAGAFSAAEIASVSEVDYLYSPAYKARGISRLQAEVRILNPANQSDVLAKTQFVRDEAAYFDNGYTTTNWDDPGSTIRGNVTTARTWVKETGTWLESHTMYDNFGNVRKVWDASGDAGKFVETQYDPAYKYAYPTRVVIPAPDPGNSGHGTTESSTAETTYDLSTGLPTSVKDDFGQVTNTEYDAFSRPTRVYGDNFAAPETQTIYGVPDSNGQYPAAQHFVKVRKQIDASNWDEAITWFDGRGRTIKTQAKDSQGDVFVETQYDNMGRPHLVSNPYRVGETVYWNKTRYDAAGRAVETFAPASAAEITTAGGNNNANLMSLGTTAFDISTATGFVGTVVTSTDASLRKGRSITNALGQLIRVDEPTAIGGTEDADLGTLPSPHQATSYKYNAQGKMVEVTQGQQKRWFKYDSLGRLLRVRQPEQEINQSLDMADPFNTEGDWTAGFVYDILGNVIRATDANGVNIINEYDRASRVLRRCYTRPNVTLAATVDTCAEIPTTPTDLRSTDTPTVEFFYDGKGLAQQQSPNFAKGKLTKVTNGISATEYMTYDNFGRLTRSKQITDGVEYGGGTDENLWMTYTYNLSGALVEERYPSGRVVNNAYESDGDLARIYGKASTTATERTYAASFNYTPDGRISRLRLGNGLWEVAKFNSRTQVTELAVGHGVTSGDVWKLEYEYGEIDGSGNLDANKNTGNVARQTLSFGGLADPFVQSYKYDSLFRLTEAKETSNGNQTWRQVFDYDRYGNRLTHNKFNGTNAVTQTAITHPSIDPASNRISSPGYDFDKNGNLIIDGENRHFAFNADNKQREVRDANNNLVGEYFYDGEGKRVKKISYGQTTETTVFVYSIGKLVAEYSSETPPATGTTNFTVTDLLGSPRVLLNSLGEVVSRRDFLPFGEEIAPDQTVNYRIAAQKYLTNDDGVRQKFTGYQKDKETALDFAEARMYENRHARFTAVDPLLASGKSANPQTFNRYVYVLNSPLANVDPDGKQVAKVPGGKWYQPTHPDGVKTYRFESTQPDGYEPVTRTNRWGDLIGSFVGGTVADYEDFYVLKFNREGPLQAMPVVDVRTGQTSTYRLTEEEQTGFSRIIGPGFKHTGAVQNAIEPHDIAFGLAGFRFGVVRGGVERGGETMLLRSMKVGDDGLPVVGESATTLGARVPRDIVPDEAGMVAPETGGMSVTPSGGTLPAMGGRNVRTFCISCGELGPNLRFRADPMNPVNHGFVEPATRMSIEAYQEAVRQTRPFWRVLDE